MQDETFFFEQPGEQNTDETLKLAAKEAQNRAIDIIILASNRGYTAVRAMELCDGFRLIAIGGYREHFNIKILSRFQKAGHKAVCVYDGLEYDYPRHLQDYYRKIAGEGGKVAPEVVVAAVVAGVIPERTSVIGVGGTFPGADTAFVVKSARDFGHIEVEKIICQPRRMTNPGVLQG